jgi:hypothetical protein
MLVEKKGMARLLGQDCGPWSGIVGIYIASGHRLWTLSFILNHFPLSI